MLRGINRQSIFLDDEDNEKFLKILKDCKAVSEFELYAYCLMGNHVHLLMKEGKECLALVFKRIGARFVFWYNWKYKRSGHLFQDRYRSEAVESEPYFIAVLRYIHMNPVKAGMCMKPDDYMWSSYDDYIRMDGIVDHEFSLGLIENSSFADFMSNDVDEQCLDMSDPAKRLEDEELIQIIEETFMIKATMVREEPKDKRNQILAAALRHEGVTTRQLSKVTGISTSVIWYLSSK